MALNAQEGWHPWEIGAIRSLTSSGERFLRPWLENTQYEKAQRSRLSQPNSFSFLTHRSLLQT